jgi:hypothetical protein
MAKQQHDQNKINQNLEQVFDIDSTRENNLEQPVVVKKPRYSKKAPSRGGKRVGGGRKPGSTNKISGVSILNAIQAETGKPFETLLAEGYHQTILDNDIMARQKYEQMFLSKVVADKHEIDHTTLGESLKANFVFPKQELPDWQTIPTKITYE